MNKFVKLHEEFIGEIPDSVYLDEYPFESDDHKHMVEKLRKDVEEKSKKGRIGDVISMLRLAPYSWPKPTVAKYFSVQVSFVTRSKILLSEKGYCGLPEKRKSRPISEEHREIIREFYENEEWCRELPGKKDCKSIVEQGVRVKKTKKTATTQH